MTIDQPKEKHVADTRTLILDATEQLMIDEGYASVSSRRVAAVAGLKSKLLHYYFRTMDDLFIAAFRRLEDQYDERFARAAASDRPLYGLWQLGLDAASTKLIMEFTALANHRPNVREMIGRSAKRDRMLMSAALDSVFVRYGIDREEFPPKVMALLLAGLARALSTEKSLGADDGHEDAVAFAERFLMRLEPPAAREKQESGQSGQTDFADIDRQSASDAGVAE